MNNPFTGYCEGLIMALGAIIEDCGSKKYVKQMWSIFENGTEPIQGRCGSGILDKHGRIIAFFRFQGVNGFSYGVLAKELQKTGYDIYSGIRDSETTP